MGAEHLSLLYCSSARWLSRGNFLSRTFELRQEIFIFLKEEGHKDAEYFADADFLIKVAYLCDNELALSQDIKTMFEGHLSQTMIWFEKYFQNKNFDKFAWIQDPFNTSAPSEFTSAEEENLIELSCDNSLKARFGSTELTEFWISIKD
jgi:hypothetical protein